MIFHVSPIQILKKKKNAPKRLRNGSPTTSNQRPKLPQITLARVSAGNTDPLAILRLGEGPVGPPRHIAPNNPSLVEVRHQRERFLIPGDLWKMQHIMENSLITI